MELRSQVQAATEKVGPGSPRALHPSLRPAPLPVSMVWPLATVWPFAAQPPARVCHRASLPGPGHSSGAGPGWMGEVPAVHGAGTTSCFFLGGHLGSKPDLLGPEPPDRLPDRTTGWCPHEESNQTQHHSEQAPLGPGFPLLPACAHKAPVAQKLGAAPMHAGDLSGELQPTWCTQVERRQVAVSGLRPEPSGPTYVGGHTQV